MTRAIDLNADLGEGMADDAALLAVVTSASVACGGHAGDAATMAATLARARAAGVACGAHPGYADREGFGRRVVPMEAQAIARMVAAQVAALVEAAAGAGVPIRHVKAHGALANLAADDEAVADAVARGAAAVSRDLILLCIAGTAQEGAAARAGLAVAREVFADRGYTPRGRLVPRGRPGAMIAGADEAAARMLGFLDTGLMPTVGGPPVRLAADSICVHGDGPGALAMARALRAALEGAGVRLAPFA